MLKFFVSVIKAHPHALDFGFRNPGNFCLRNPESGKILVVESGIGILGFGIRNIAQRNPES